jgi:hypothetical protein
MHECHDGISQRLGRAGPATSIAYSGALRGPVPSATLAREPILKFGSPHDQFAFVKRDQHHSSQAPLSKNKPALSDEWATRRAPE